MIKPITFLVFLFSVSLAQSRQETLQLNGSDPYYFAQSWVLDCWLYGAGNISEFSGILCEENNLIAVTELDSIPGQGSGQHEVVDGCYSISIQWPEPLAVVDSVRLTSVHLLFQDEIDLGDSLHLSWIDPQIPELEDLTGIPYSSRLTAPVRMHLEPDWVWAGEDEFNVQLWMTTDATWLETIGLVFLSYENTPGIFEWTYFSNYTTDYNSFTITDSSMYTSFDFWNWGNQSEWPDSNSVIVGGGRLAVSESLADEVFDLNGIESFIMWSSLFFENQGTVDQPPNSIQVLDPSTPGPEYSPSDIQVLQDIIDTNDLNLFPVLLGLQVWEDTRLVELNLSNLDPEYEIETLPSSISNLNLLRKLRLNGNLLSNLPDSIGELDNLVELHLTGNLLTELPESIGELQSLEYLYISFNPLHYLPDGICDLTNLKYLNAYNCQLTELPECFGQLGSLEVLRIEDNQLTSLPYSIGNLSSLDRLDADDNSITELPPTIGSLPVVTEISLIRNDLQTLPDEIGDIASLESLDLRSNQLMVLPETINDLSNLFNLRLDQNQLSSLPEDMSGMNSLGTIACFGNQFVELPVGISTLPNLQRIQFAFNDLLSLPDWVCDLNLEWSNDNHFNVEHNRLCSGVPECVEPYIGIQDCTGYGTIYYVNPFGSNENQGTIDDPYFEIQFAVNQSSHGDTILLQEGTYIENVDLGDRNIILSSNYVFDRNPLTIVQTVIDGNQEGPVIRIPGDQDQGCRIIGLTITNGGGNANGGGIYILSTCPVISHCNIVGNVTNGSGGGIFFNTFRDVIIDHVLFANNTAEEGSAVFIGGNGGYYQFINCTVTDNVSTDGSVIYKFPIGEAGFNNTIFSCGSDPGCEIFSNDANLTVDYSILPMEIPGTGNLVGDPLFSDPGIADYTLQENSPCIDAGDPDNDPDPDCTLPDMGAFFFNQCADSGIAGDIILDGVLDILDIVAMVNCIMEGNQSPPCICADLNEDCILDILDIVTIVNYILET